MMCGDMGSYSMVISLGVNLFELEEFTNTMGLWQNGSPFFFGSSEAIWQIFGQSDGLKKQHL